MPLNGTGLESMPPPLSVSIGLVQTISPVASSRAASTDAALAQPGTVAPRALPPPTTRMEAAISAARRIACTAGNAGPRGFWRSGARRGEQRQRPGLLQVRHALGVARARSTAEQPDREAV